MTEDKSMKLQATEIETESSAEVQTFEVRVVSKMQTHKITFTSNSVQPAGTPVFYYVAHEIEFDRIVFVAIVEADSASEAEALVTEAWEDATVRRIECGASTLPHHNVGPVFGTSNVLKPSVWRIIGRHTPLVSLFVD